MPLPHFCTSLLLPTPRLQQIQSNLLPRFASQARLLATSSPAAAAVAAATGPKTVNLTIDGASVTVPEGFAIIQACESAGVPVPRFCYHSRLGVAGNCRMCLVEVAGAPKPIASCAVPVANGMVVKTSTPLVHRAREGVLEFLLANHPLDCPVCDQGGECDLQDLTLRYGRDRARDRARSLVSALNLDSGDMDMVSAKRAVTDHGKDMGPLVATCMTRCIHCTRCVRFANELAGLSDLGTKGRGNTMEIATYLQDEPLATELAGNLVDLCPVGALTARPHAFLARPWELARTDSVDVHDALGSAIRVDARGQVVIRVLPREHADVNQEWISDKARFACDGLRFQRLTVPLVNSAGVTWETALQTVAKQLQRVLKDHGPGAVAAVAGQLADAESMLVMRDWLMHHGVTRFALDASDNNHIMTRESYVLPGVNSFFDNADAILLVGCVPRREAAVLNMRIRSAWLAGANVAYIGNLETSTPGDHSNVISQFNYSVNHLTPTGSTLISCDKEPEQTVSKRSSSSSTGEDNLRTLEAIAQGTHPFAKVMRAAKKPLVLVGSSVYSHPLRDQFFSTLQRIDQAALNIWKRSIVATLQSGAGHVAAMDLGFTGAGSAATNSQKQQQGPAKMIFLLNADTALPPQLLPDDAFVVYIGHHGDCGAHCADVVLPAAAYTEKDATYVNLEGRAQRTAAAVSPPGAAREDWAVVRALAAADGVDLPYHTLSGVRQRMQQVCPLLLHLDHPSSAAAWSGGVKLPRFAKVSGSSELSTLAKATTSKTPELKSAVTDFFQTNAIARASRTMAQCTEAFTLGVRRAHQHHQMQYPLPPDELSHKHQQQHPRAN